MKKIHVCFSWVPDKISVESVSAPPQKDFSKVSNGFEFLGILRSSPGNLNFTIALTVVFHRGTRGGFWNIKVYLLCRRKIPGRQFAWQGAGGPQGIEC
jgi:hypothetical protein